MSFAPKLLSSSSSLRLSVNSRQLVRRQEYLRRPFSTVVVRRSRNNSLFTHKLTYVPTQGRMLSSLQQQGTSASGGTGTSNRERWNMILGVGFFGVLLGFTYMFYEDEDEEEIERRRREYEARVKGASNERA